MLESHESENTNVFARHTDRKNFLDFTLRKAMSDAFFYLFVMKIVNTTCNDPSLLSLDDPSENIIISCLSLSIRSYFKPSFGYFFRCFIKSLLILIYSC